MNQTIALRAKKLRTYIIAHPGSTRDEIYAAHPGEILTGGFDLLQRHGMVRFENGGKKGPARWYASEAIIKNHSTARDEDHETETRLP